MNEVCDTVISLSDTSVSQLIFRLSPTGLLYTQDGHIRHANNAFAEMFGLSVEQLPDFPLDALAVSGNSGWLNDECVLQLENVGLHQAEHLVARRCGELFWCRISGRTLAMQQNALCVVWSVIELSDRRSLSCLSAREQEVALFACEGRTAKEIGRSLSLSPRTVEAYLARLKQKLGARNATELVNRIRSCNRQSF